MAKSKENDQGRYFEYLVTKKIHDLFDVSLTKRAERDQERDHRKEIDKKKIKSMEHAAEKICNWISNKLDLDKNSILDRLPDREHDKQTHEDISIIDKNNKTLSFSLKHNHDAIFHGRIGSVASNNWLGIEKNKLFSVFEKNKRNLIIELQKNIPIGTVFAGSYFDSSKRKGIKKIYWKIWKHFIEELHNEVIYFFNAGVSGNKTAAENLFKKIVGSGRNQHRVLKKGKKVFIQTIEDLKMPKMLNIKNIQIPNDKDPRSIYVWHLVLKFDNGMIIKGRTKQDGIIMKGKGPDIKTDWQVSEWGDCGMIEQEI